MPTQRRRPFASLIASCSILWALHGAALAADLPVDAHAGLLKTVRGEVQLQDAQGASTPARVGDAVNAQQRIVTGAQSGASVVLRDGTTFVIGPQSSFDLQTFRYDSRTHDGSVVGRLARGTLRMVTGLIGKATPEAIRIDTPTATIGIRGTDFIVSAGETL
ncbi:MAG: FecR domain-containing protein [Proteobacteria bacterium]|nr:FecR domain-containing protein [Pseudomonadota bacterium]